MLVGRETERRRLDALLAAARLGQSGVLVLSGEAGIGKTALLDDVRERARGTRVLAVTGTEAERDLPFAGLAQLRLTPDDLNPLPPPQAQALGVALALRTGGNADRFAVGAGLLTLLAQLSESTPLCLIVDDAHHLDPPSADALLFVARRLLADPIAVVIAVRDGEPSRLADPVLPRLPLTGLGVEATRELVRATTPGATDRMIEWVAQLSLGNPLAIAELAADPAALEADGAGLPGVGPPTLPDSLSRVYAQRADALSPDALAAARCAALCGTELSLVARVCAELGVAVAALAEAEEADLLSVDGDQVRFRHPLIRSALYSGAAPTVRRRLHAAAARAIGTEDPDRRAWHRSAAVLGPDEAVAVELDGLAERAAERSAYSVAAWAAQRAASVSVSRAERARRLLAVGTWAWRAGEVDRARRALAEAAEHGTETVRTRADHLRGVIAVRSGPVDESYAMLRRAAAETTERVDALASLSEAVDAAFYLGDAAAAVATADAIEGVLAGGGAGPDARARALIAAGCARVLAGGDGGTGIRSGLAQLAVADAGDEPALAAWAVIGPLFLRDSSTGRQQLERAVRLRRDRSAVGELPHLLFHIARDEAAADRWDRAEADYTEAIGLARELGQSTELAASLAGLAWLEARSGRAAAVEEHVGEALALCTRYRIHLMALWAHWAEADLAYGLGSIEKALAGYTGIAARLDQLRLRDIDLSPAPEIAECTLRLGQPDRARLVAADYDRRAQDKGQPWALARSARLRALLTGDDDLDAGFGEALGQHDATLDVFERARTQLLYGSRLLRARRRVDARSVLQEALDTFARLGATPWAGAAADELAATGANVTRPGVSPRSRLTPRELQIAVLLTEGRSTREAASAVFLSPKTVEYHLRNVYTKLGVSSRTELAALLQRG